MSAGTFASCIELETYIIRDVHKLLGAGCGRSRVTLVASTVPCLDSRAHTTKGTSTRVPLVSASNPGVCKLTAVERLDRRGSDIHGGLNSRLAKCTFCHRDLQRALQFEHIYACLIGDAETGDTEIHLPSDV